MRKLALLLPVLFLSMFSCKEGADNSLNMKAMEELIYKNYPSVNRVSVEVEENTNVFITLGDEHLYSLPDADKQKIVNDLGNEIIRIFDAGNWLNKGRITFAKQESTIEVKDSVVYTINLDSLKKAKK